MKIKNVNTSFLPMYYLGRLLGTISVSRRKNNDYEQSFMVSVFTFIASALQIFTIFLGIQHANKQEASRKEGTINLTLYFEPTSTCIFSKRLSILLKSINSLDNEYFSIFSNIHYKGFIFNLLASILYPLLYVIISIIKFLPFGLNLEITKVFFLVNISHFSTISSEAQFVAFCNCLKQRFCALNSKLEDLSKKNCSAGKVTNLLQNTRNAMRITNGNELPNTLETLRKAHVELCTLALYVNSIYGIQLFICAIMSFFQIPLNMYNVIKNKEDSNLSIISNVAWCLSFVLRLFVTLKMCSSTVHERYFLQNFELSYYFILQLALFSRHLLHQKVEFSACGFFTMDMPLFISV
ncbi:hypothetical protein L9F63_022599, partial [Diploptera punctata]